MRFYSIIVFFVLLVGNPAWAQKPNAADADYFAWSATHRLTAADFQMPLKPNSNLRGSSAAFGYDMDGNLYMLLGKQANNIIFNRMLRTASWLDTTDQNNMRQQLLYQQTLFDIQEIYVRHFRQQARAGAKKMLLIGKPDISELLNEQVKAAQLRQAEYTEATEYGTLPGTQAVWESLIQKELQELQAYEASAK